MVCVPEITLNPIPFSHRSHLNQTPQFNSSRALLHSVCVGGYLIYNRIFVTNNALLRTRSTAAHHQWHCHRRYWIGVVVNPPQAVTLTQWGLLKDQSTTTRKKFTATAFKELLTNFTAAINRCGTALWIIYSRTNNSAQITTNRTGRHGGCDDKVSRVIITNGIPQSLRTRDNSSCT